jgi:hypothetical protein
MVAVAGAAAATASCWTLEKNTNGTAHYQHRRILEAFNFYVCFAVRLPHHSPKSPVLFSLYLTCRQESVRLTRRDTIEQMKDRSRFAVVC